jgi:seryl-tRNA synthetase
MIDLKKLIQNPDIFKHELERRGKDAKLVDDIIATQDSWKQAQLRFEELRSEQKTFNTKVVTLSGSEKQEAIEAVKSLSEKVKDSENQAKTYKATIDELIKKIPSLSSTQTPVGKDDSQNVLIKQWGRKPEFDFEAKPYWELATYKQFVSQEKGAKAMGSRGFYMDGDMALFQRALFDFVLDRVLANGLDLMYVPLMLNEQVLTGTGHIPDFDGQQYQVPIDEGKSFYLIGSSEPSIMGYFMDSNVGSLDKPILKTCWSSCFRKEAGSYGKDQQGILRVHQFEKIEMVAICKPEQAAELFIKFGEIEEEIYSALGLYFQAVEVCTGDMPVKHYRQIDYEGWFPYENKFRELASNGNASDYQNRGLGISYNAADSKDVPWGLNCTAVTFRTGLSILEQCQQADGSVKLPEVLAQRMHKQILT